jgi:hypothetical protein
MMTYTRQLTLNSRRDKTLDDSSSSNSSSSSNERTNKVTWHLWILGRQRPTLEGRKAWREWARSAGYLSPFLMWKQRVFGIGARFFFLHIVCIVGLLFVLYHFFGLGVLNLSPSFIIPTCCYHIGMNGKSFS